MDIQDIPSCIDQGTQPDIPHAIEATLRASHCIVLTPSSRRASWIAAIADAAAGAGLHIVDDIEETRAKDGWEGRIAVISDAGQLVHFHADHVTIIMTGLRTASDVVSLDFSGDVRLGLWEASRLLAATAPYVDRAVFVTDDDLLAGHGSVVLSPALVVTPPGDDNQDDVSELGRKCAEALGLYHRGPPAVGASTNWPADIHWYDDRLANERASREELDVTGRPRTLVFGPYISLPPGVWRARVRFAVDARACRHRYRLEWGTQTAWAAQNLRPGRPGSFEASIDFAWEANAPAEVRLILTEGSLGGTLTFLGQTVERIL